MLAARKLPGRTLSRCKRLISDVRLSNARRGNHEYPLVETPRLDSGISHIWKLWVIYHGVPVAITTRDGAPAFKRISVRPDDCVILPAEFDGGWLDSPTDIIMIWWAVPFDRGASPGSFQAAGNFANQRRNALAPSLHGGDGSHAFHSVMYIDDAIMAGFKLGNRLGEVANSRVGSFRTGLGAKAAS